MNSADSIRDFVYQLIIIPARLSGESVVEIMVSDVCKMMGLYHHSKAVYSALDAINNHPKALVNQVIINGKKGDWNAVFSFHLI